MHCLLTMTDAIFPLQSRRGGYSVFDLTHMNARKKKAQVRSIYNPVPLLLLERDKHLCSLHHPISIRSSCPLPSSNIKYKIMYTFPSPPSSPIQHHTNDDNVAAVVCGSCNKPLEKDWFCINCHQRCTTCSRILGHDEHCTRCWAYDTLRNVFVRKPAATLNTPPSPPLAMIAYFPCNSF